MQTLHGTLADVLVETAGAPRGERHFLLYNPPLVDQALHIRRNLLLESVSLADLFLARGLSTIVFARGRQTMELLLTYLRSAQSERGGDAHRLRGYRGGYLPHERRAIEKGLRSGLVTGVVATNALELGVDIGELSICVLCGYPGTVASTWQQAGRAGRRRDVSATILVGGWALLCGVSGRLAARGRDRSAAKVTGPRTPTPGC